MTQSKLNSDVIFNAGHEFEGARILLEAHALALLHTKVLQDAAELRRAQRRLLAGHQEELVDHLGKVLCVDGLGVAALCRVLLEDRRRDLLDGGAAELVAAQLAQPSDDLLAWGRAWLHGYRDY